MTVLDRFLLELVREQFAEQRGVQALQQLVLEGFELDPKSKTKRSEVYAFVAERLDRVVNNDLCITVRDAVTQLPKVYAIRTGPYWFRGLKRRTP